MPIKLCIQTNIPRMEELGSQLDSLSNSSWKLQVFTKTTEHKTKRKNHKVAKIPHVLSSSFSNPTEIKINA